MFRYTLYIIQQCSNLIFGFAECKNGKYGLNCKNNCSHCQQDTQCHNVNGWCLQGCSPGYIGPFYNLCKQFYIKFLFVNKNALRVIYMYIEIKLNIQLYREEKNC